MTVIDNILSTLDSLITQVAPLRIRRDGSDHLIADPPMTRAEAIEWLWEGRVNPPEERFRPDPIRSPAAGPQQRFLFGVTPEEFMEIRSDFAKRYFAAGPGIALEARLPKWLPQRVREEIVELDEQGQLRNRHLPRIWTFSGDSPWGDIVMWAGRGDFLRQDAILLYQYFPEDAAFYRDRVGDEWKARLLESAYTTWNEDMRYFVEERGMRPDEAREEILRVHASLFGTLLEAFSTVIVAGGGMQAAAKISDSADGVADAVQASYLAGRRALGLAGRRGLPAMILYRGTTLRWLRGGSNDVHDLGIGCYFTNKLEVATEYAGMRGTATDPAIILRLEVTRAELGRVLDLVDGPYANQWNELVQQVGTANLSNERYLNLFTGFLKEIGRALDDFDTIIGKEYLRGGVQINIRRNAILDDLLKRADEIWQ